MSIEKISGHRLHNERTPYGKGKDMELLATEFSSMLLKNVFRSGFIPDMPGGGYANDYWADMVWGKFAELPFPLTQHIYRILEQQVQQGGEES